VRWRDKKPHPNTPEGPGSGWIPSAAVLGRSLAVRGELAGHEDLLIEGQFDGNISVPDQCLTVASGAQVKANIQARRAIIHGSLSGKLSAREKIEVRKTARVTGDLVTAGIVVEEGACFNGSIELIRDEAARVSVAKTSTTAGGHSQS
jgi:cytoskeletal protein CcmA (bactofilin family)